MSNIQNKLDQIKISFEEADRVYQNFNFERVHGYMQLTNFKWSDDMSTLDQIKITAKKLLYQAVNHYLATGQTYGVLKKCGFCVYYFPFGMELVFKLESASSY